MPLKIKIIDNHFTVTDGCKIDSDESNNSRSKLIRDVDSIVRSTSSSSSVTRYLYWRNVYHAHDDYLSGRQIKLKCPICKQTYEIGPKELRIAEKAYQKLGVK